MRLLLTFCVFFGLASALCNCFNGCCTSDADCSTGQRCRIGAAAITITPGTSCDASLTYGVCTSTEPVDPCANFACLHGTPTPSGGTCYCRVETPCPYTARVTSPLDSSLTIPLCCERQPVTCDATTQYQKDCWNCACKEGYVAASAEADPASASFTTCVSDPCASTTCAQGQICVPTPTPTGRLEGQCVDSCPGKRLADGRCCSLALLCPAIACVEPFVEDPTVCCPRCLCPAGQAPDGRGNCTTLDPCRQCTSSQSCERQANGAYQCIDKACPNGTSLVADRCCPEVCPMLAMPLCAPGYTLVRTGCCEWSCHKDSCDGAEICPACAPGYTAAASSTGCCPDCTCDGAVDPSGRCLPDPCNPNPCLSTQRCETVLAANAGVVATASYLCVDPDPTQCSSTECGPAPALALGFCPGSCEVTGSPQCVRQADGTCGWKWNRVCPPDPCSTVLCPAGSTCQSQRTLAEDGTCSARPACVPDSCAVSVNGQCCASLSAAPAVAGAVDPLWACPDGIRANCDGTQPCACPLPDRVTTCWDGSTAGSSLDFCLSTDPSCPCSKSCPPSPCDNCEGLCALVLDPSCASTTEVRPDCVCAGGGADCCPSTATSMTAVPPTPNCPLVAQCLEVKQLCASTTCPAGTTCVERGARAECVRDGCTTYCPSTGSLRDTSCGFLSPIVDAAGCYLSCGAEVCTDLPRSSVEVTVTLTTATTLSAEELEALLTSTIASHCPSERPACVTAAFSIQVSSVSEDGSTVTFTVALTDSEASDDNRSALESAARAAIQPATNAAPARSLF